MAGIFGYKKNQPDGYCSIWSLRLNYLIWSERQLLLFR